MKILFCASESHPFIKVGGLGDVIYSLPKALAKSNNEICVILPLYKQIKYTYRDLEFIDEFYISLGYRHQYVGLKRYKLDNVTYYFIDNEQYFGRETIYGDFDDGERFTYFSKAIVEVVARHFRHFDVLHCNDWQTAMVPLLVREYNLPIKTVFTIHNLKFQGIFSFDMVFEMLGLPAYYMNEDKFGFYGNANYLKSGIVFADRVTTVSPTYAEEIKQEYYGEKLDGLINEKSFKISGILNGIDYDIYDPKKDRYIAKNYNFKTIEKKYENKEFFQREMQLPQRQEVPMIGMVSRLTDQKGLDLIVAVLDEILQMDLQLVIIGTGDAKYENILREYEYRYHDKMRGIIKYDFPMASRIYASTDIYLMPSKFEPCGLSQMIAMRYGSIPLVRETGGLKDTVKPYNQYTGEGNGFSFTNYNAHEMLFTIQKAVGLFYDDKPAFKKLIESSMSEDFSWKNSSSKYNELYKELI